MSSCNSYFQYIIAFHSDNNFSHFCIWTCLESFFCSLHAVFLFFASCHCRSISLETPPCSGDRRREVSRSYPRVTSLLVSLHRDCFASPANQILVSRSSRILWFAAFAVLVWGGQLGGWKFDFPPACFGGVRVGLSRAFEQVFDRCNRILQTANTWCALMYQILRSNMPKYGTQK